MDFTIPKTMKAMVIFGKGDIRLVHDKPVPAYNDDEVLVKVAACGICGSDVAIINSDIPMPAVRFGSFTPGHEWDGTVVAVGSKVTEFKPGDRIAVQAHHGCGRCDNCLRGNYTNCLNYGRTDIGQRSAGMSADGGFAEYAVHHVSSLYKIPDSMDFLNATYLTTLGSALWAVESAGGYMAGDSVFVSGDGPVGLSVVQVCKVLGAKNIILAGTARSAARLKVGAELGATRIINIDEEKDPLGVIMDITEGLGCEYTFDCVGSSSSINLCIRATARRGTWRWSASRTDP